jgi:hypothetical protein
MTFATDAEVAWAHGVDQHTGLPKLDNTAAALVSSDFGLAVNLDGTNYIDWGSVFGGTGNLTYAGAGLYTSEVDRPNVLSLGDRATFRPNGVALVASWYTYSFSDGWQDTGGGAATVVSGTGFIAESVSFTFVCTHDGTTNILWSKQGGVVSKVTVPCSPRDSDPHPLRAGLDDESGRSMIGVVSHLLASSQVADETWALAFLDDPTIIEAPAGPTFNAGRASGSNTVIQP